MKELNKGLGQKIRGWEPTLKRCLSENPCLRLLFKPKGLKDMKEQPL